MEQIYAGLGVIDPDRSKKEIEEAKQNATEFPIQLAKQQEAWGIWMKTSEKPLLVNPIALVNSLFTDGSQYDFFLSVGDNHDNFFTFQTERLQYAIEVALGHRSIKNSSKRRMMFEEYVDKVQSCCVGLAEKVRMELPIAYDEKEISKDAILTCAAQVEMKATLPSYYVVRTADVVTEPFTFNPLNEEWHEQFEIRIGNRGYKTWLTHWDSDMEAIRHELESIVYEGKAVVRLPFDTSETRIIVEEKSALDKATEEGTGISFQYKDYMLVEIHPNEFVNMPILKGYCDRKEMIRSLYEGLLRLALQHPETSTESDVPSRMVAYNKIKSPLIESYLKGTRVDADKYAIRQVHVEHILTIGPDYDQLFVDEKGCSSVDENLVGNDGNVINLDELIAWQSEIAPIVIASETGQAYDKDWADYHQRGLALAYKLREKLPTSYDLWYTKLFEDKNDIIKCSILII